jgi:hypothetical protein
MSDLVVVRSAAGSGYFAGASVRGVEPRATTAAPSVDVRAALTGAGNAVRDAVASTSGVERANAVATAVANLNQVLDTIESEDLSADFRASIANAVRGAVAAVTNGAPSGLTVERVDGKERLVIDSTALAETLANDPQALDAFVTGSAGLPEGLSIALADEARAALAAQAPATVTEDPPLRGFSTSLRALQQLLDGLPISPRFDVLV